MLKNEIFIVIPQKEYFSFDVVSGYVEIHLALPAKTTGVMLTFFGQEIVDYNTKNKPVRDSSTFVSLNMILNGPGSKDYGKTLFGGRKKVAADVPAGVHRYPFAFKLPGFIPCSFRTAFGRIEYSIKATLESADKNGFNLEQLVQLQVGGSLFDLNYIGNYAQPTTLNESKKFMFTSGTLDVALAVDSKIYLAGDPIRLRLDINNKTSKLMEMTRIRLVQHVEYLVANNVVKEDTNELACIMLGQVPPKHDSHPAFEMTIPSTAPESVSMQKQQTAIIGKCVRVAYKIIISGTVKGGSDLLLEQPIFVVRRGAKSTASPTAGTAPPQLNAPAQQPPAAAQRPAMQPQPVSSGPPANAPSLQPQYPLQQQPQQQPPVQQVQYPASTEPAIYPSLDMGSSSSMYAGNTTASISLPPVAPMPPTAYQFDFSSIPVVDIEYDSSSAASAPTTGDPFQQGSMHVTSADDQAFQYYPSSTGNATF